MQRLIVSMDQKEGVVRKGLKISPVYISLVVLVVAVVYLGSMVTGSVTAHGISIEAALNETQNSLSSCQENLTVVTSNLSSCSNNLQVIAANLTIARNTIGDLTYTINRYSEQNANLTAQIQAGKNAYSVLLMNSVKAICCRPGLNTTNWSNSDGVISCSGSQTLSCV